MYFYVLSTTDCATSKQEDSAKRGKKKDDGKKISERKYKEMANTWEERGSKQSQKPKYTNYHLSNLTII